MVKIPENIRGIIEDYLEELSSEIEINKAVLFGSYARGDYGKDSDMDRIESIKYLLKRARKYRGVDLQPVSFTNQDYEERLAIVEDVLRIGIEVYTN